MTRTTIRNSASSLGTNGDVGTSGAVNGDVNGVTPTTVAASTSNDSQGFTLLLLPVLLFKFAVVLCVKFATDAVVFPLLWTYRLARMGKRKVVGGARSLFGKKEYVNGDTKVNGDASP